MVKKLQGSFYEKELQKLAKKNFEYKKYLKEKVIKCKLNGNDMIIVSIVGSIKKDPI